MNTALKLLGLIFGLACVVMIFAAVFMPGRERLDHRGGVSPSGWAAIYAVIFGVACIVCNALAIYGSL